MIVNNTKYYEPLHENINYLCNKFSYCKKVLEIGPGISKFPLATHFIDHIDNLLLPNVIVMDITMDKLPYQDNEFDLVYCRHVLEDVDNPAFVIKELIRVSKIIYIETPSPFAEVTRYIDGSSPYYRGYIHHRSIIWVHHGTLKILQKFPQIEYINIDNYDDKLKNPYYWNTYFIWDKINGDPNIKILKYDVDYNIHSEYEKMIKQAVNECEQSIKIYIEQVQKTLY
jgi:SAM-dependent methyltransferase